MKKFIILGLSLAFFLFTGAHATTYQSGCTATTKYSATTGNLCTLQTNDCAPGDLFSAMTGKSCTIASVPQIPLYSQACIDAQAKTQQASSYMNSIESEYANQPITSTLLMGSSALQKEQQALDQLNAANLLETADQNEQTACQVYTNTTSATAICNDFTYSYSQNRSGTCSYHGGVLMWL